MEKEKNSKNIMDYATVTLLDAENAIEIIDQTKLPGTIELIRLKSAQEIWDAIYLLKVRGAPAIGVVAGFGIYLLAKEIETEDYEVFYETFQKQKEYLNSSRPTAVNLSWALNRMERVCIANKNKPVAEIKELLHKEALEIQEEDIRVCKSIGEHGLTLVKPGVFCPIAMPDSLPPVNMELLQHRFIWGKKEVIIFMYLQMRQDLFCRGRDLLLLNCMQQGWM